MRRSMTLAAIALASFASMATAQTTPARMAVNDTMFAEAACSAGIAELGLSEIGAQRATDAQLKEFSTRMVQEHGRMHAELNRLAAEMRIPMPRQADFRAKFCAESLSGLTGEEFDRAYAKAQLVAHMEAAAAFEAEAERGQNPQLKAFAAKGLPHIREHLKAIWPIAMKYEKERMPTERR